MDSDQSSWYLEYGRVPKWEYTPVFGQLARTHDVQNHWILGVPNFGTTYQQRTSALSLHPRLYLDSSSKKTDGNKIHQNTLRNGQSIPPLSDSLIGGLEFGLLKIG
jgi:hypothetical protein